MPILSHRCRRRLMMPPLVVTVLTVVVVLRGLLRLLTLLPQTLLAPPLGMHLRQQQLKGTA